MKHRIIAMTLFTLLGSATLWAGGSSLSALAQKEQELSRQIKQAYLRGSDPAPLYNRLIRVHREIRHASSNPEVDNMAAFLTFCLQDLRQAITAPRNRANAEIVSDLDSAIQEGAGYIQNLSRGKALAAR